MKNVIEILGIVLPALIIVLGIVRIFVKKTKGVNGLTMLFAILLLVAGLLQFFIFSNQRSANNSGSKAPPLTVSKHSEAFNTSMSSLLTAYYEMTEGFVNWDTAVINKAGSNLNLAFDNLNLDEIKKDSLIYQTALDPYKNAKNELRAIIADPSFAEKRGSLNILSDNIRNLLVIVKYDGAKVYWQECPMAFDDEKPGNWLSRTKDVRNPYLGTKDPKYGNSMLECGGPKDTINFVVESSIQ